MTTALVPIALSRAGADFTAGATIPDGAGNTWPNTGKEFLAVLSGAGSPITVTFHVTKTLDGAVRADRVVTVPAAASLDQVTLIGPFPTDVYNDGGGNAKATCSDTSSIRVAVITGVTTS